MKFEIVSDTEKKHITSDKDSKSVKMGVGGVKGYIIHPNLIVSKCLRFCHLPH